MKFDQLKDFSYPNMEKQVLQFWEDNEIFKKSLEATKDCPHFVFYEGPPTANGRPGIHHVLSRTIKDLICRYKTMNGFRVDRKGGWDTHGLPVEIEVQKRLGIEHKPEIIDYGVRNFIEKCKESVFEYIDDWKRLTRQMGYWIDLDNAYVTLTDDYVESVWWILKNLFDRDLIYKGFKTVPYCPKCETGLSSHEVAQGYAEVKDPSLFVKMKAVDEDYYFLVWTTTPWTLPSNAALAFHPEADYALIEYEGEKMVLAEALIEKVFGKDAEVKLIEKKKGTEFQNKKYIPLFDFFYEEHAEHAWYIVNADFVTLEDGTGIVHIAPGYGADDYAAGKKHGLPVLQAVAANGYFEELAGKYAGKYFKKADPAIINDLKAEGKLFKTETYAHNYPFCWRCDNPLIYISRHSWYIKTTEFKKQLLRHNNTIKWHPDDIRTGRMLDWLENNVDWALSRERFWGTPLPIWVCNDNKCGQLKAAGSIEEIKKEAINTPEPFDVHKPGIDEIKFKCNKCGGEMTRTPEVIDTWFDSGAMPYAQWHYPFENKEIFENKYPCDFISEGIDQTRGWFYTLIAISTMLFDKEPFKNVIVHSHVLDNHGKKMSKSKGNIVNPFNLLDKTGADSTRWYLMHNSNPWLPKKFDERQLTEVIRKFFDTLKNSYAFFALYANIDNIAERAETGNKSTADFLESLASQPERTDRWVVSRYNTLVEFVTEKFDNYDITPAVRRISDFVLDDLSNWYIRLNRRRFWAPDDDPSKMRAYWTLHHLLCGVSQLSAPIAPFISEFIYRQLARPVLSDDLLSVHLQSFPKADNSLIDTELENAMSIAQKIVSAGRAARSRRNIKVRQPLSGILVNIPGDGQFDKLSDEIDTLKEELNVKTVENLDDVTTVAEYQAKLNFAAAGPKLGGAVKEAAGILAKMDTDQLKLFIEDGTLDIKVSGQAFKLTTDEVTVTKNEKDGFAVESSGGITVALKTEIDDILRDEGFAREMVNKIQNMRKTSGFEVTDRISVRMATEERLTKAIEKHYDFICSETLAENIELVDSIGSDPNAKKWNINGIEAEIAVLKK